MKPILSDQDLEKIKQAVASAEKEISGEIVPVILAKSSTYHEVFWKGCALSIFFCFSFFTFLETYRPSSLNLSWILVLVLLTLSGLLGGALGFFFRPLKRLLIGDDRLNDAVLRRAKMLFLDNEVFNTQKRTGILLLISLFEHKVLVLGDTGIYQKAPPHHWEKITQQMIVLIKKGNFLEAMLQGIQSASEVLKQNGFLLEAGAANPNELSDKARIYDK